MTDIIPCPMPQKTLYVSDLDGTLLNRRSQLSATTVAALNRLAAAPDFLFTVATARTPATVSPLLQRIHTPLPYIVMAGAALWDNGRQEYREVQAIAPDTVDSLLRCYAPHGIRPFLYRRHGAVIRAHHSRYMTAEEKDFLEQRLCSPLKKFVVEDPLSARSADETMLVFSMGRYDALRAVADDIEAQQVPCTYMCYHDIFRHDEGFLEIYAPGTTKAAAIRRLARQTGAERVVVFGDNLNDLPMMREADRSVAVGNAFPEVRAAADEVIGTNDEDAVVKWIEADFLKDKGL